MGACLDMGGGEGYTGQKRYILLILGLESIESTLDGVSLWQMADHVTFSMLKLIFGWRPLILDVPKSIAGINGHWSVRGFF